MAELMELSEESYCNTIGATGGVNLNIDVNQIATATITNLVKHFGSQIYTYITEKHKDSNAKREIEFLDAFDNYLSNAKEKYGKTKTLLYRKEPKNLYDFYECIGVRDNKWHIISTSEVKNILDISHFVIISGTGGIGKTTLLKHFFLNTIESFCGIPIFVELRNVNNNKTTIEECIYNNLKDLGFNLEQQYFEYSLEVGCYVFLLDGFDEIKSDKMSDVSSEIRRLSDKYPNNYYILTSRPTDSFIGWNRFTELESMNLNKQQAVSLICKIDYTAVIKEKFVLELENGLFEKLESFASNPLLLTIMLLTFEDYASIPDKLHTFYDQAFVTLFSRHDATKEGYQRIIESSLTYDDFRDVFSCICFKSFFHNDYQFSEPKLLDYITQGKKAYSKDFDINNYKLDLVNSVCMLVQDDLVYSFTHRSFQEYFAALYTTKLSDEEQKAFLISWIKTSNIEFENGFLKILSGLEEHRFNKIILIPLLEELKKEYVKQTHPKEWILNSIFSGYSLDFFPSDFENGGEDKLGVGSSIKSGWIYRILKYIEVEYNYVNVSFSDDEIKINDNVINYLWEKYDIGEKFILSQIKNTEIYDDFFTYLHWHIDSFDFAMDVLKNIKEKDSVNLNNNFNILIDRL